MHEKVNCTESKEKEKGSKFKEEYSSVQNFDIGIQYAQRIHIRK